MIKGNFLVHGRGRRARACRHFSARCPSRHRPIAWRWPDGSWIVTIRSPRALPSIASGRKLFGQGIVETEEDFGTQGRSPSHPELLDWLAVEYMRSRLGHEVRSFACSSRRPPIAQSSRDDAGSAAERSRQSPLRSGAAVSARGRNGPRPGVGPVGAVEPENERPLGLSAAAGRPVAGRVQRATAPGPTSPGARTAIAAGSTRSGGGRFPIRR